MFLRIKRFHHRVTQRFTEFYFLDLEIIELCEPLCYSVVKSLFFRPPKSLADIQTMNIYHCTYFSHLP
ncbi:hypothetical protein F2Y83_19155 [Bacteroides cellulosilyticus]|uniref:Uncharacterized protein n=1 Tax=Bacteroides cellulosilyticus TaxID=246787 RepID=A0A5M6A470_9BACE|nr:hypothetical protein F2Y86_21080 [Bacteroides cellulosilyticus]KAA5423979.1 hypothetical protein F2Y70_20530 [Bacteroides cellulosilyticus]KAA5432715.1 hypothetical protein F2Y83_19155 [Bacteroides cellulosilyticus]KAA5439669.1 hypothetical protein F2Y74_08875 [Bacteroides cellulosilyticus]KAA5452011.1 hypothetical protein F2Y53_12950 [Bacteroides cellulosilyticus]